VKVFLDTNVLVASIVAGHADHVRAFAVLERVQARKVEGVISAHSLAETYAILTKLPAPFRHSPEQALLSIQENILKHFKVSSLSGGDYAELLRAAALAGVQGGTIYDAVLMKSAAKEAVGEIFTLNFKHFKAVAPPELEALISIP
jgi:predicted nucleic acid-binding protein